MTGVQKRGGKGKAGAKLKQNDSIDRVLTVMSHDTLLFVTTTGTVYKLRAYSIPERQRTTLGAPLGELIPSLPKGTQIAAIVPLRSFNDNASLLMLSRGGVVKRTALQQYEYEPLTNPMLQKLPTTITPYITDSQVVLGVADVHVDAVLL